MHVSLNATPITPCWMGNPEVCPLPPGLQVASFCFPLSPLPPGKLNPERLSPAPSDLCQPFSSHCSLRISDFSPATLGTPIYPWVLAPSCLLLIRPLSLFLQGPTVMPPPLCAPSAPRRSVLTQFLIPLRPGCACILPSLCHVGSGLSVCVFLPFRPRDPPEQVRPGLARSSPPAWWVFDNTHLE